MTSNFYYGSCSCWQCQGCHTGRSISSHACSGWTLGSLALQFHVRPPPPPPQPQPPPLLSPHTPQRETPPPRRRKRNHVPRPMNPFMVWAKIERRRMAREHPDIHNVQLSRLLGDKWKAMSHSEKVPYIMEADRLKQQHLVDHPGYKYQPRRRRKHHQLEQPKSLEPVSQCLLSGCCSCTSCSIEGMPEGRMHQSQQPHHQPQQLSASASSGASICRSVSSSSSSSSTGISGLSLQDDFDCFDAQSFAEFLGGLDVTQLL